MNKITKLFGILIVIPFLFHLINYVTIFGFTTWYAFFDYYLYWIFNQPFEYLLLFIGYLVCYYLINQTVKEYSKYKVAHATKQKEKEMEFDLNQEWEVLENAMELFDNERK